MKRELANWNESPFGFMRGLEREIGRVFDDAWISKTSPGSFFTPTTEIEELENNYLLSVDLPGFKREDIHVEVQDNQIDISGERKNAIKKGENGNTYSERTYGKFSRSFSLPKSVDSQKVEANYENGVLHLVLPKSEKSKTKKIEIQDQKGGFLNRLL